MNELSDQQLLHDYVTRHSDAAFAELVRRHVDLVYSAALRMVCEAHSAQDVTQGVFVALAQEASRLSNHPTLSGWLHCTARNLAAKTVRGDVRRRAREQEAAAMNELLNNEPAAAWEDIAPHLDAAMGELSETDRDALLLRYFENKSLREVGVALGMTDDTARKRVNRAVERLRQFLEERSVAVEASGLVGILSTNAIQAAPIGMAATISTAALGGAATLAAAAATKPVVLSPLIKALFLMTKSKIAIAAGTLILLTLFVANSLWTHRGKPPADASWPVGETRFKEDWKDRGGATPGATLETVLWAMTQDQPGKYFEAYYNNPELQVPGLNPVEFREKLSLPMAPVVSVTLESVQARRQPNEFELKLRVNRSDGQVIRQSTYVRKSESRWNCIGGSGPNGSIRF